MDWKHRGYWSTQLFVIGPLVLLHCYIRKFQTPISRSPGRFASVKLILRLLFLLPGNIERIKLINYATCWNAKQTCTYEACKEWREINKKTWLNTSVLGISTRLHSIVRKHKIHYFPWIFKGSHLKLFSFCVRYLPTTDFFR